MALQKILQAIKNKRRIENLHYKNGEMQHILFLQYLFIYLCIYCLYQKILKNLWR